VIKLLSRLQQASWYADLMNNQCAESKFLAEITCSLLLSVCFASPNDHTELLCCRDTSAAQCIPPLNTRLFDSSSGINIRDHLIVFIATCIKVDFWYLQILQVSY